MLTKVELRNLLRERLDQTIVELIWRSVWD